MIASERELLTDQKFSPNTRVRVRTGFFVGRVGTVVDQEIPTGSKGTPFPKPGPHYYWVRLELNRFEFTAHLHEDEIEPADY